MFFLLVMGVLIGVFLTFFLFLVILAFAPELSQMISPVLISVLKDVAGPVAAGFGGAIAGAVCSYIFQRRIESAKETKSDISIIHKTSVHLIMQLNDLFSTKKHAIYPSVNHAVRFLDISKIPSVPNVADRIDPGFIDIALSVKDASAIDTLYLAESRYRACFENFANRNDCVDEYRALIKNAGLGRDSGHDLYEIYEVVGEGMLVALHVMTEQMIEVLDEALETINEALTILNDLVEKKYNGLEVTKLRMDIQENAKYLEKTPPPHFSIETLRAYFKGAHK